jgi:hypothetical protein
MGAYQYERHVGRRTLGLAVFAAMCCLAWGLPAAAQATVSITSLEPSNGPTSGGTTVTIHGEPLENARSVHFGTVEGKILHEECDGECEIVPYRTLVVESPPHAAGTVDVTVETGQGASFISPGDEFTYVSPGELLPPSVFTSGYVRVTGSRTATVEGRVDPEGQSTTVHADYALRGELFCSSSGTEGSPAETAPQALSGTSGIISEFEVHLQGLVPGSEYCVDLVAHNASGTSQAKGISEFSTLPVPPAPTIESESVSHVTQQDGILEAKINPDGLSHGVFYQFQVVKNPSEYLPDLVCPEERVQPDGVGNCGFLVPPPTPDALPVGFIKAGSEGQSVSQSLSAAGVTLSPSTTYHYRIIAIKAQFGEEGLYWEDPSVEGADQTFTTPPAGPAPVVDSESISPVTAGDATLQAGIDSEGLSTLYQFHLVMQPLACDAIPACLGQTYSLPSGLLLGSFLEQSVSLDLNSTGVRLQVGREYAYWVSAISTAGTTEGAHQMFRVPSEEAEPLSTTTLAPSGGSQPAGGGQLTGSGGGSSSSAPAVTPLLAPLGKTITPKVLNQTQKPAKELKVCEKKPKGKRAACQKQARGKYRTTASKAKKR